jgi:hypothetical protein
MTRCPFCNHENRRHATRCTKCGADLTGGESPGQQEIAQSSSKLVEGTTPALEDRVVELLLVRRKIDAIKIYREQTGTGLKDAKDAVEAIGAKRGIPEPKGAGCSVAAILFIAAIGAVLWFAAV